MLYYTNGSHKVFVKVLCGWSVRRTRSYRCEKNIERQEFNLGMPKAPQVNIPRILKHLSLGMPRLASHLSSSTNIGIPRFLFCSHDLCPLCFSFSLRTMPVWDVPSSIYRILHVLHLYILSMILWELLFELHLNLFEYGFIEYFVCFTYIFWAWILVSLYYCRMLHGLHLYLLEYE